LAFDLLVIEGVFSLFIDGGDRGTMKNDQDGLIIPLQVGSELRITNDGEITVDNPELELAVDTAAADAVLSYRFDPKTGEHTLRLLAPVANRKHMASHRPDD
jgi:hypothetical protein